MTKKIKLHQGIYTLVDDEVYNNLNKHKWLVKKNGEVYRNRKEGGSMSMHREIMGLNIGNKKQVTHINKDRLDNRQSNLAISGIAICPRCKKEFMQRTIQHKYCWDCKHHTYLEKKQYTIYKRDKFRCAYCGRASYEGAKLQLDHIVPRLRGGENKAYNLITACAKCNRGKSHNSLDKDLETALLVEVEKRNIDCSIQPEMLIVDRGRNA